MLTSERARKLAAIRNGRASARRQRAAGFPNLRRARLARHTRSLIRIRLGVISLQWAARLRRHGRIVGDWSGLVDRFGFSENLMRRIMQGDLHLPAVPAFRGEQAELLGPGGVKPRGDDPR